MAFVSARRVPLDWHPSSLDVPFRVSISSGWRLSCPALRPLLFGRLFFFSVGFPLSYHLLFAGFSFSLLPSIISLKVFMSALPFSRSACIFALVGVSLVLPCFYFLFHFGLQLLPCLFHFRGMTTQFNLRSNAIELLSPFPVFTNLWLRDC
jgi:hypothetical protein